jgi:DNA-binding NarL/FixJ family response regulator
MLDFNGFQVIPVANADEALEVLSAVPGVRVVVTDVKLASSSMDGFALAQKVWEERRIGVLVISGHATPKPTDLPPEIYFIAKPIYGATLVHLIRDLIEQSDQLPHSGHLREPGAAPASPQPQGRGSAPVSEPLALETLLTPRQRDVLELLIQGKPNHEIAQALRLSENTVKVHLAAIFRSLGVSSRIEAVLVGMRLLGSK